MNKDEYYNKQIRSIMPRIKPVDNRNFFERNGKLLVIMILVLTLLSFAADAYVRHGLNYIREKLSVQDK